MGGIGGCAAAADDGAGCLRLAKGVPRACLKYHIEPNANLMEVDNNNNNNINGKDSLNDLSRALASSLGTRFSFLSRDNLSNSKAIHRNHRRLFVRSFVPKERFLTSSQGHQL